MFLKLIAMLYWLIDGFFKKLFKNKNVTEFDLFIENFLKSNSSN